MEENTILFTYLHPSEPYAVDEQVDAFVSVLEDWKEKSYTAVTKHEPATAWARPWKDNEGRVAHVSRAGKVRKISYLNPRYEGTCSSRLRVCVKKQLSYIQRRVF